MGASVWGWSGREGLEESVLSGQVILNKNKDMFCSYLSEFILSKLEGADWMEHSH